MSFSFALRKETRVTMSFPTTETSDIPLKADSSIVRPQVLLQSRSSNSEKNCCIYCLANVVHPRLGRGESYTCGYKPYRCDICNYSTVTKGNLAIHEQSDRHLNNLQVVLLFYKSLSNWAFCAGYFK